MTLTSTATETLDTAAVLPQQRWTSLPKLFWAGVSLFVVNMFVMGVSASSPELRVNAYGAENSTTYESAGKPSPFTEVIGTANRQPVKAPVRVVPVIPQQPVLADLGSPADLVIPRYSESAARVAIR
ncbi:MAG: hypothetical protein H7039_18015 [Bryobacteraceae bacterium]|nr:hypothetical protein [Bryobacteraceae bacterium]